MRNYKDSNYALNRYSHGIVYKFADNIVEVTLEDFPRSNPDQIEEKLTPVQRRKFLIHFSEIFHKTDCENGKYPSACSLGHDIIRKIKRTYR